MTTYNLIKKLESILEYSDLKSDTTVIKPIRELFKDAIEKLKALHAQELSGEDLVKILQLQSLPTDEAGYYLEFVNTNTEIKNPGKEKNRTEIFYLMNKNQVSCLHSLKTRETWRWIEGSDILLYVFSEEGEVSIINLNNKYPEYTIEPGKLFGAKNSNTETFGLVTCECIPGFTLDDYESPSDQKIKQLSEKYAGNKNIMDVIDVT